MAHRHLREAELARQRRHLLLMLRVTIGVHEHDCDRPDAVGERGGKLGAHRGEIGRALHRAVGAHALVDLDDALEQHLGLDDVLGENLRPRLVADLERVAKSPGGQQQRPHAFALQECIGGNGGAHFYGTDAAGRDRLARLQAEQVADALNRGIAICAGVLGEQLVGDERAVGATADHVGKGAAAVDPEMPIRLRHAAIKRHHRCSSIRDAPKLA